MSQPVLRAGGRSPSPAPVSSTLSSGSGESRARSTSFPQDVSAYAHVTGRVIIEEIEKSSQKTEQYKISRATITNMLRTSNLEQKKLLLELMLCVRLCLKSIHNDSSRRQGALLFISREKIDQYLHEIVPTVTVDNGVVNHILNVCVERNEIDKFCENFAAISGLKADFLSDVSDKGGMYSRWEQQLGKSNGKVPANITDIKLLYFITKCCAYFSDASINVDFSNFHVNFSGMVLQDVNFRTPVNGCIFDRCDPAQIPQNRVTSSTSVPFNSKLTNAGTLIAQTLGCVTPATNDEYKKQQIAFMLGKVFDIAFVLSKKDTIRFLQCNNAILQIIIKHLDTNSDTYDKNFGAYEYSIQLHLAEIRIIKAIDELPIAERDNIEAINKIRLAEMDKINTYDDVSPLKDLLQAFYAPIKGTVMDTKPTVNDLKALWEGLRQLITRINEGKGADVTFPAEVIVKYGATIEALLNKGTGSNSGRVRVYGRRELGDTALAFQATFGYNALNATTPSMVERGICVAYGPLNGFEVRRKADGSTWTFGVCTVYLNITTTGILQFARIPSRASTQSQIEELDSSEVRYNELGFGLIPSQTECIPDTEVRSVLFKELKYKSPFFGSSHVTALNMLAKDVVGAYELKISEGYLKDATLVSTVNSANNSTVELTTADGIRYLCDCDPLAKDKPTQIVFRRIHEGSTSTGVDQHPQTITITDTRIQTHQNFTEECTALGGTHATVETANMDVNKNLTSYTLEVPEHLHNLGCQSISYANGKTTIDIKGAKFVYNGDTLKPADTLEFTESTDPTTSPQRILTIDVVNKTIRFSSYTGVPRLSEVEFSDVVFNLTNGALISGVVSDLQKTNSNTLIILGELTVKEGKIYLKVNGIEYTADDDNTNGLIFTAGIAENCVSNIHMDPNGIITSYANVPTKISEVPYLLSSENNIPDSPLVILARSAVELPVVEFSPGARSSYLVVSQLRFAPTNDCTRVSGENVWIISASENNINEARYYKRLAGVAVLDDGNITIEVNILESSIPSIVNRSDTGYQVSSISTKSTNPTITAGGQLTKQLNEIASSVTSPSDVGHSMAGMVLQSVHDAAAMRDELTELSKRNDALLQQLQTLLAHNAEVQKERINMLQQQFNAKAAAAVLDKKAHEMQEAIQSMDKERLRLGERNRTLVDGALSVMQSKYEDYMRDLDSKFKSWEKQQLGDINHALLQHRTELETVARAYRELLESDYNRRTSELDKLTIDAQSKLRDADQKLNEAKNMQSRAQSTLTEIQLAETALAERERANASKERELDAKLTELRAIAARTVQSNVDSVHAQANQFARRSPSTEQNMADTGGATKPTSQQHRLGDDEF